MERHVEIKENIPLKSFFDEFQRMENEDEESTFEVV